MQLNNNINIKHMINTNTNNDSNLNVMYINIRSIRNKLDKLETLLQTHTKLTHIIVIAETWLYSNETHLYNIPNYEHLFNTRPTRAGGVQFLCMIVLQLI